MQLGNISGFTLLAEMTRGSVEASRRNFRNKLGLSVVWCFTIGKSQGCDTKKALQCDIILCLVSTRAGHPSSICCMVPTWPSQSGSWHRPSGFTRDQWRTKWSVLYLPESILAVITALLTSKGLRAVDQIGWWRDRDMKEGLKYWSDGNKAASPRSLACQKSKTFNLQMFFHWSWLL